MKKTNKGFTIVELVIVIAVIAILAAVLIPTFTNLIEQANMSVDEQLVAQMNKVLNADEIINGKPTTVVDAIEVLEANGITNIKANLAGNSFYWVGSDNRVLIWTVEGENGKVTYPKEYEGATEISVNWTLLANAESSINHEVIEVTEATDDALFAAISEAVNGEGDVIVRLPANSTILVNPNEFSSLLDTAYGNNKSVTIDLNGSTFETLEDDLQNWTITVPSGSEVVFANGTMNVATKADNDSAIGLHAHARVVVRNVHLITNGNGIFANSDASEVLVVDSRIEADSIGVTTNAATSVNTKMVVRNSYVSGSLGVMMNTVGMAVIEDSEIYGWNIAVQVRQGEAVIENCELHTNFSGYSWNLFINGSWGQANSAPCAVLQVGNNNGAGYQNSATCTVKNTSFHMLTGTLGIYIEGNHTAETGATLNYENCKFYHYADGTYTNGTEITGVVPTLYSSSLAADKRAFVYSSNAAGYITINGEVKQDGN